MSAEPRRILFRQPRPEFFNAETNNDAHKLMGKFRYHTDFEIALRPSALKGNAFVYKSTASRAPLRAFVLGKVKAIEIFNVHQEDAPHSTDICQRLTLEVLQQATDAARRLFSDDVNVLHEVMLQEKQQGIPGLDIYPWAERKSTILNPDLVDCIFINCGTSTDFSNGHVNANDSVLVDVSLHRFDASLEENKVKVYSLVAHGIERISDSYLHKVGMVAVPNDAEPHMDVDIISRVMGSVAIDYSAT